MDGRDADWRNSTEHDSKGRFEGLRIVCGEKEGKLEIKNSSREQWRDCMYILHGRNVDCVLVTSCWLSSCESGDRIVKQMDIRGIGYRCPALHLPPST